MEDFLPFLWRLNLSILHCPHVSDARHSSQCEMAQQGAESDCARKSEGKPDRLREEPMAMATILGSPTGSPNDTVLYHCYVGFFHRAPHGTGEFN